MGSRGPTLIWRRQSGRAAGNAESGKAARVTVQHGLRPLTAVPVSREFADVHPAFNLQLLTSQQHVSTPRLVQRRRMAKTGAAGGVSAKNARVGSFASGRRGFSRGPSSWREQPGPCAQAAGVREGGLHRSAAGPPAEYRPEGGEFIDQRKGVASSPLLPRSSHGPQQQHAAAGRSLPAPGGLLHRCMAITCACLQDRHGPPLLSRQSVQNRTDTHRHSLAFSVYNRLRRCWE